jgi:Carbohydrate family 9 binding domain-like
VIWEICFLLTVLTLDSQTGNNHSVVVVPTYRASRASGPIQIDGAFTEFDWLTAQRIRLVKIRHDPEDRKPLRENTEVAAVWDEQNLYLRFIVQDREMWATNQKHDARLWPEECVEIFLDPDGDGRRYIEAQVNWHGNVRDILVDGSIKNPTPAQFDEMARWDFRYLQTAVQVYRTAKGEDLGWTLEMAIPWTELSFSRRHFPPKVGQKIRINFYRVERPHHGPLPVEWSGWNPVPGDLHDPSHFGQFVFSPAPSSNDFP